MVILVQISKQLLEMVEGENWTDVCLKDLLSDLSYQEAAALTLASPNTIASILNHLTYWNGIMLQRIQGVFPPIAEKNGFDVPALESQAAWQHLQNQHRASTRELAEAIPGLDEKLLDQPIRPGAATLYHHLQGLVEHAYYHMGQIILLKQLIRS